MTDTECHICCETYEIECKYQCNHIICYKCATRLLYLYKDPKCPICKSSKGKPLFQSRNDDSANVNSDFSTDNSYTLEGVNLCSKIDQTMKKPTKNNTKDSKATLISLEDISITSLELTESLKSFKLTETQEDNEALYKNKKISSMVKELLAIKCKECKSLFNTKKELMNHMKNKHGSMLCSTCLDNNHQFWYEYATYNPETLGLHRRGQTNEGGFEGHIFCLFCSYWLYNKDTAKKHCYQEHQICTVCDVLGKKLQFYKNYAELESHYQSMHFCCSNPICRKNHCYVYAYKSELCAHSISHHGLDMQLCDISTGHGKNPQFFSLQDKNAVIEPDTLYSSGVNIVSPLVSEPFFPSFNKEQQSKTTSSLPSFLNRQIIHEADAIKRQRCAILKDITPNFFENISSIIEKYIGNTKSIAEMVSEIEECVGKEKTLRILQKVSFLQKQKETSEFIANYKEKLKFPAFKKETKTQLQPSAIKQPVFRIIDFTKKK